MPTQQACDARSPNGVVITGFAPVLGKGLERGVGGGGVNVGAVIERGLDLGREGTGVLLRVYALALGEVALALAAGLVAPADLAPVPRAVVGRGVELCPAPAVLRLSGDPKATIRRGQPRCLTVNQTSRSDHTIASRQAP